MATFNVVMRRLQKGQHTFTNCLFKHNGVETSQTANIAISQSIRPLSNTSTPLTVICLPVLGNVAVGLKNGHHRQFHHQHQGFHPVLTKSSSLLNNNSTYLIPPSQILNYSQSSNKDGPDTETKTSNFVNFSTNPDLVKPPPPAPETASSAPPAGDNEQSDKKEKKDKWYSGKNSWKLGMIFMGGSLAFAGGSLIYTWGAPQLDPDGNEIQDEHTDKNFSYLRRTWQEMNIFKKTIQDPSRDKLLPEPLKYPYMQPPYTLVLELKDVLIHPDWTYGTGWRFKKRPALDYFLSQVGPPLFEVVIYSKESGLTIDPIVTQLDPQGFIMYRLYRDATRYMDNHHVKDLSCLNREMSKIIMIDCEDDSVKLQPRNSLVLKKWDGEDSDKTLVDLAHFLKTVAASGVDDIRPVLDYYHKFDDPLEAFKENQIKFQEEQEARNKAAADDSKKKSWLSGLGIGGAPKR